MRYALLKYFSSCHPGGIILDLDSLGFNFKVMQFLNLCTNDVYFCWINAYDDNSLVKLQIDWLSYIEVFLSYPAILIITRAFQAGYQEASFKIRIPFPRRAKDRKWEQIYVWSRLVHKLICFRSPLIALFGLEITYSCKFFICVSVYLSNRDVKNLIVEMLQAANASFKIPSWFFVD